MWDFLGYEVWTLALAAGLVFLAVPFAVKVRARLLTIFVGFAVIETGVVLAPLAFGLHLGHWNWIGKVASIAIGLAALPVLGLTRAEVGLVMPTSRRGWIVSVTGMVVGPIFIFATSYALGANHAPDVETLLFQATMPGLDEELTFRGVGFAILTRGFSMPQRGLASWALPLAVTTLWFTIGHVVSLEHGRLGFLPIAIVVVLPLGLLFGAVRVSSESLLGCVIVHNVTNVTAFLAAFLLSPAH